MEGLAQAPVSQLAHKAAGEVEGAVSVQQNRTSLSRMTSADMQELLRMQNSQKVYKHCVWTVLRHTLSAGRVAYVRHQEHTAQPCSLCCSA